MMLHVMQIFLFMYDAWDIFSLYKKGWMHFVPTAVRRKSGVWCSHLLEQPDLMITVAWVVQLWLNSHAPRATLQGWAWLKYFCPLSVCYPAYCGIRGWATGVDQKEDLSGPFQAYKGGRPSQTCFTFVQAFLYYLSLATLRQPSLQPGEGAGRARILPFVQAISMQHSQ